MNIMSAAKAEENPNAQVFSRESTLGKEDFLKLLVAQLRHQDPINPMDNTEFVAQLAEFSALEQMQNVDAGVQNLEMIMQSVNNALTSSLIGKNVKYLGDSVVLSDETEAIISYDLQNKANVSIKIFDEDDNLIATVTPGEQLAGNRSITWDGKDVDGEQVPNGVYRYEIQAHDSEGNQVPVITYTVDRVRGVKFDEGNAIFTLTDRDIYQADVIEILESNKQ